MRGNMGKAGGEYMINSGVRFIMILTSSAQAYGVTKKLVGSKYRLLQRGYKSG
ncbi:MAG: hypothetical protein R2942_17350 [Ignavibacteria bacterium]